MARSRNTNKKENFKNEFDRKAAHKAAMRHFMIIEDLEDDKSLQSRSAVKQAALKLEEKIEEMKSPVRKRELRK